MSASNKWFPMDFEAFQIILRHWGLEKKIIHTGFWHLNYHCPSSSKNQPFQPPFQVRLPVCSWIPELPHTAGVVGIRNARNRKNPTPRESKTSSSYANAVGGDTVDQSRLVVYPIIYTVFYIPGDAEFQPSTVVSYTMADKTMKVYKI